MICKSAFERRVSRAPALRHRNALIQTHRITTARHPEGSSARPDKQLRMNRFKTSKYKNTTPKIPKKDVSTASLRLRPSWAARDIIERLVIWVSSRRSGADALMVS